MSEPPRTALEHFTARAAGYEATIGGASRELARYLLDIAPPIDSSSLVLDNACGPGIAAQEVLYKQYAAGKDTPKIACADAAPPMVEVARATVTNIIETNKARSPGAPGEALFEVMGGEDLSFPDNHFTHSITNLGILFFKDAEKGAEQIYRTLKPDGTALVTSWKHLSYVDVVQASQKVVMPEATLFRPPVPPQWFEASHMEKTLRGAGFDRVEVHEKEVFYGFKSMDQLCGGMMTFFGYVATDLSEETKAAMRKQMEIEAEKVAIRESRVVRGSLEGQTEELIGFKMTALIAVAKK